MQTVRTSGPWDGIPPGPRASTRRSDTGRPRCTPAGAREGPVLGRGRDPGRRALVPRGARLALHWLPDSLGFQEQGGVAEGGCALWNAPLVPTPRGGDRERRGHSTPGARSPSSRSGRPRREWFLSLSCRGGGSAGLGAIIWEDAVPCPAGAVVSPLKNPEPHCSGALQPGDGGDLPPTWRKGPRPPRTPCLAAAPADCTWRVGTPPDASTTTLRS
ncbi:hypothetical protein R6Z07F_003453 [Ovis aries]